MYGERHINDDEFSFIRIFMNAVYYHNKKQEIFQ
jgi:hypothetical protein